MKLDFLGRGSAFNPLFGNTCAYWKEHDTIFLLDCGETVFDALYRREDLEQIETVYVILTHMHADHVGSLGTLISYFYCVKQKHIHIVHPNCRILELLKLMGVPEQGYIYHEHMPEDILQAEAIKVKHAQDMECYGYILKDQEECLYYSGDSAELPDEILKRFLKGEIERIYHDTSTHDSPNPSHCYYGKLEQLIPQHERHRVYCMHLDSDCEGLLKEKGFQVVSLK